MTPRVLVVDDEQIIRESLSFILQKEGYEVDEAPNGQVAYKKISENPPDIVITDIEMPGMKGLDLLEKVKQVSPQTFVIIITAYGSIESAIQALRKGAYDYILKPLDFDELVLRLRRLTEFKRLVLENQVLHQEINREYEFHNIIGQSAVMKKVYKTIERVSQSDGTVLITGKSGTGKELVARAIHHNSARKANRFVPVNCGAIPDNLFESELFGHKKGAFTDAVSDKDGLFKVANGGTLFLDEVSETPLHLQVKLLRAIEQKEITPVGGTTPLKSDVRIIAATNQNLTERVEQGKFRDDLYYRLNVIEINLPSLSERREDVPLLVQHFIEKFRNEMEKPIEGVDNKVMHILMNRTWKGEVRELQNVIERAMIFCDGEYVTLKELPENIRAEVGEEVVSEEGTGLKEAVRRFEKNHILELLTKFDFDKEKTASALDISVSTLYRKMTELGVDIEDK
ncbi:MAG: sigma-54 dependent transcriptional regulator [Bacteroidota bacterium]